MLDIEFIRQNPDQVREGAAAKNLDPKLVDKFLRIDNDWRVKVAAVDHLRAEQNTVTAEMKKSKSSDVISRAQIIKKQLLALEKSLAEFEKKRWIAWSVLPNLPSAEAPLGKTDKENVVIKEAGVKKEFSFAPKDYLSLAENFKIIDVKRAVKISGSRFGYFLRDAVLLEFALIDFVLKILLDEKTIAAIVKENNLKTSVKPFVPIIPPVLINRESMWGMGYMDHRGAEEIYSLEKDKLYLVGTSEQSIGAAHQGETFKESELPFRYAGFSTCFRREAGSYGKDTKGILRVHQFDKVEMFSFVSPENSQDEHKLILAIEEYLMSQLKIPYRVLNICTGDLGGAAAAKFDVEAWLPGQNNGKGEYRETHSASNNTDFQSRRLNIRYAPEPASAGKAPSKFVYMLNGTAFAIGRTLIAILENYQTAEGFVEIPEVLRPFFAFKSIDGGEYFIRPPEL